MAKLLFWILLILGGLIAARLLTRQAKPPPQKTSANGHAAQEAMVQCAHCGVYLPHSEALQRGGQVWCSQEHARLGTQT